MTEYRLGQAPTYSLGSYEYMNQLTERAMSPTTKRVVRVYLTEEEYAVVQQFLLDLRAQSVQEGLGGGEQYTAERLARQALLGLVAQAYRDSQPRTTPNTQETDKC